MTLLSHDHWNKLGTNQLQPWDGTNLVGANSSSITVHGTVDTNLKFAGIDFPTKVVVVDGLTAKAILGLNFLEAHECIVNIKKFLELPRHDVSLLLERTDASCTVGHLSTANVRIQHTQHIPARSDIEVMGQVEDFISGGEWIIEQDPQRPLPVMVARAVITPQQEQFPVRILNLGDEGISLHQGTKLTVAERLDWDCVGIKAVSSAECIPNTEDTDGQSNDTMGELDKNKLYHLLVAYRDVFAADKSDFGRTNHIQHTIETDGASPVHQRSRRIAPAQQEETTKLLQDMLSKKIIQLSTSPWASL